MEVRQLAQPAVRLHLAHSCRRIASPLHQSGSQFWLRRHQSTTNRTKRALNVPPHKSFLTPAREADHIVFNPPSSAASVYHTPFKFLPKTDPRRSANLTQLFESSATIRYNNNPPVPPSSSTATAATSTSSIGAEDAAGAGGLPPTIPTGLAHLGVQPGRHVVSKAEVAEMRALRAADPRTWSVLALARKFRCSALFVIMCCQAGDAHRAAERARLDRLRARWGPIRTKAREDRRRRMDMLMRGEL